MNWKVATFTVISIILYAYILVCFGLAGQYTQHMALVIGACVLKYGLILFGFFIAGFLPYRINTALKKRKDALYEIESERKLREAAAEQKRINNKISNEYMKNEDAI
jgi:uncharacterized membrane protein